MSTIQEKWIRDFKAKLSKQPGPVQFLHYPPEPKYYGTGTLNVNDWNRKPILLLAPHFTHPGVKIPCANPNCHGIYKPSQWHDTRVIHGLHGPVTLLQYRYACSDCGKKIVASEVIKSSRCPDTVRVSSNAQCYLTQNSGVTGEVLNSILSDVMSAKSFDEIQMGLMASRTQRYLQRRTEYVCARELYCHINQVDITSLPDFSPIDGADGYNESITIPSAEYIIDVFIGYVFEHKEFIIASRDALVPWPVVSVDHTFNVNKRTRDLEVRLPPERVAAGTDDAPRHVMDENKSATLIFMGANGQVLYWFQTLLPVIPCLWVILVLVFLLTHTVYI
jgi:hypothetical protein